MSASESRQAAPARPRADEAVTLVLWLALLATIPPLLRVVHGGDWVPFAAVLSAAVLALGFILRRRRVPSIAVTVSELALWAVVVTGGFFSGDALLGIIPTPAVVAAVPTAVQTASAEIVQGVAPIEASPALAFVIVASLGLLTIALDHVVLTARMPLLAGMALVAVWLIPAIAVPAGFDAGAFVLLAACILLLIRAEHRTREARTTENRPSGVTAVAVAIGAVAIVGALVIAPALPQPTVASVGSGLAARIDPSLDLGEDLRRQADTPVLTMHGDAAAPPNLRVATLSLFDGDVWLPDRTRSVGLDDSALEPVAVDDGIRVTEYRTDIDITQLSSTYLPVPFPAVEIDGLQGAWRSMPYGRTVMTSEGNTLGQSYEVVSHVPRPTLEQIRSARARIDGLRIDVYSVPEGTPPVVTALAEDVTVGADTDYDKLIALQTWFRGSEFTYSLTAPVQDGFDDAGVQAVADFLDKKEGYCVHFAGAFALMARTLGMPSRIVVGFLPGAFTGDTVDGERVTQVTTAELHAWPEVYFEGIGWVPFEPTKSRGTATRFLSSTSPVDDAGQDVSSAAPSPTPTRSAATAPTDAPADRDDQAAGPGTRAIDLRPLLTVLAIAVVLLAAPGLAAGLRRLLLRRRGTVAAAWRLVQEAAVDVGAAVPSAETPRGFGARLVATHDAPADAVARLVGTVERESYGAAGDLHGDPAERGARALADADDIRRGMLAGLSATERIRAVCLPRSLVLRPGSAFADRDAAV